MRLQDYTRGDINAAFICLWGMTKPLKKSYEDLEGKSVPFIIMQQRWDGRQGFPGGKVEATEGLAEGAIRELKEELNWEIKEESLSFVCTHLGYAKTPLGDSAHTHLYSYEITYEKAIEILKHFTPNDEVLGLHLVLLEDFGTNDGIINTLKQHYPVTVREEIATLCTKLPVSEKCLRVMEQNVPVEAYTINTEAENAYLNCYNISTESVVKAANDFTEGAKNGIDSAVSSVKSATRGSVKKIFDAFKW